MSEVVKNETISGNLEVSHDLNAGGHATVGGNASICGNVVIGGLLTAGAIAASPYKGIYPSVTALEAEHTRPVAGSYAFVGTSNPMRLYSAVNGVWVSQGSVLITTGDIDASVSAQLDALEGIRSLQLLTVANTDSTASAATNDVSIKLGVYYDGTTGTKVIHLPVATSSAAGVMCAQDYNALATLATNDIVVGDLTVVESEGYIEVKGSTINDGQRGNKVLFTLASADETIAGLMSADDYTALQDAKSDIANLKRTMESHIASGEGNGSSQTDNINDSIADINGDIADINGNIKEISAALAQARTYISFLEDFCDIPHFDTYAKTVYDRHHTVMEEAYAEDESLVYLPEINFEGDLNCDRCFAGCEYLRYVAENPCFAHATSAVEMFKDCTSLEYVDMINLNNADSVEGLFFNCEKLRKIRVLHLSDVKNVNGIFQGCGELRHCYIADFGASGIEGGTIRGWDAPRWGAGGEENRQSLVNTFLNTSDASDFTIVLPASVVRRFTTEEMACITGQKMITIVAD